MILAGGVALVASIRTPAPQVLRAPLSTIELVIAGYQGEEHTMGEAERRAGGTTAYLLREYTKADGDAFSIYVGYYDRQKPGHAIHSPKNCLPGAGWEALDAGEEAVATTLGVVPVNRYLLARRDQRVLVLYWYQGRGRVTANEYRVKWNLLRDAAVHARSDEALVRIVVPLNPRTDEAAARRLGLQVAQEVIPGLRRSLPAS
jgi:EpsI family protein